MKYQTAESARLTARSSNIKLVESEMERTPRHDNEDINIVVEKFFIPPNESSAEVS